MSDQDDGDTFRCGSCGETRWAGSVSWWTECENCGASDWQRAATDGGEGVEAETHHFDYGHGVRVDDVDVGLYEMSKMMAGDAVSRAKKIHADENEVKYSKLVGKKLYQRAGKYRTKRTYVVVAEQGDLR